MNQINRYRGCLVGLAVGDCVGASIEFKAPGSFKPIDDMVGGGPFNLKVGEWTDDTSLALCLAESLLEIQGFDEDNQMSKYAKWKTEGYLSSTGYCFDTGITTRRAIQRYLRSEKPYAIDKSFSRSGNGSIMRLAPVPMFYSKDINLATEMSGKSSSTTHSSQWCVESCKYFGSMIAEALNGKDKETILRERSSKGLPDHLDELVSGSFKTKNPPDIKGSGFVVESLEAALWSFYHTNNFKDGCLKAVNLGDDSDTTAAVYGQLAGAFYGIQGIPEDWINKIVMKDLILKFCDDLYETSRKI